MDVRYRRLSDHEVECFRPLKFFRSLAIGLAISLCLWAIILGLWVW